MLVLEGKGPASIFPVRGVDTLLIEFCASENSELTRHVPYRSAALRITEKQDLTCSSTVKAIISIMRAAHEKVVKINVWASTLVPQAARGDMSTPRWAVEPETSSFPTH